MPVGGLTTRTTCGNAIAADLVLSDGATVSIVGAYGVSGSNCANFVSCTDISNAASFLNDFMLSQAKLCDEKSFRMIVAGDINFFRNSVSTIMLDHRALD